MTGEHGISIWYFIGWLLVVYGALILGQGLYELASPPEHPVVLHELRVGIWWGILMLGLGALYTRRFSPGRGR